MTSQPDILAYIGTYTGPGKSEGIYVYRFDPATGGLTYLSKATGIENPSFLAIHPAQRYLYAVNEISQYAGKASGAVTALAIDPASGALRLLNQQPTTGTGPCHLSVDASGRCVLVANYGSGSVTALPIRDDGSLGAATAFVQHEGSSVNPERQKEPHAHAILPDPFNRYAFAPDLGIDRILIYRLNPAKGALTPNDTPWVQTYPGAGPRHFTFHPNGRYAYVINELGNTFTAFTYEADRGALEEIQTLSTLPGDFTGVSHCADVHVHPSGRFIYGSNRGHDSIAICAIDETTGRLTPVGHESVQGENPRNFAIDPTGTWLLVANQNTDNIVTFRIDAQTGRLQPAGQMTETPTPVCIKMMVRAA